MNIHLSKTWALFLVLILCLLPLGESVHAQDEEPGGPVYIVQDGDTLWDIAQRFGVPWEELARANDISDPGQLSAGDELIIPGIEDSGGILVTTPVPFGESLRSLTRRYQLTAETIIRLNHLTSPAELYRGFNLVLPEKNQAEIPVDRLALAGGDSLIELALRKGVNPWQFVVNNSLPGSWGAIPGDVLLLTDEESADGPGSLPGEIAALTITPDPLVQGKTSLIQLVSQDAQKIEGRLADYSLNFFESGDGKFSALQGIHALTLPGLYPLVITGELANGVPFGFSQSIFVASGDYSYSSLQVPEETIDPEVTGPEDELWTALAEPVTPERLWEGVFQSPVAPSPCGFTDSFGNRRSYNGSPYNFFHTGLDFCYNYNNEINEIYAPAAGVVIFAGPLVVRGNAVMIDHGLGIYSGYMHQAEILVEEGEKVEVGQVIGIVGGTGRVNGPHLHLEIWAGGVQVDPLDWLETEFP